MAINVSQAFHRTSANPIDESLALTKAQMLTVNDNLMPNKYLTVCQDDGKIYLYDKANEPDVATGKFREFEGSGEITIDSTPTQGSANAVSSGGTYTALAGKVDAVSGKGLSTNDYTTADKDKLAGINLSNYVPTSQKGANNGVATLGSNGKIPMSQIPNGLDETIFGYRNPVDELFYEDAEFTNPINPQAGIFYYDELSTNFYRWTGSDYVSFTDGSTGLVIGEVTGTAYDGGKGKENRDAITAIKDGQSIDSFGDVETALDDKVDKVSGKGLSTNDYDNTEKTKVTNAQPKTLETAKTIEGASVTTVQGVADAVQTHTSKSVTDNNGVHGFKVTVSSGETTLYYKSGNSWEEISVGDSIQKAELPTASQDNVGMVLQYVGDTTSVAPIYKHGYFYECVEDSGSYSWQNVPLMDVQEIQKVVLPTASADEFGNIYQYVGSTTQTYKKGFFYECTRDGASYEWVSVRVQAGGGQTIQYDIMPTASGENEDDIIQYIGATTQDYTNGYFYKCVAQGTDPETYAWEAQPVQEGGSGSAGHTIENASGIDMTARTNLQFVGATVTDDSINDRTVVSIASGSTMQGATSSADGKSGLVPKPLINDRNSALFGDGTWRNVYSANQGSTIVVKADLSASTVKGKTCTLTDGRTTLTATIDATSGEAVFTNVTMFGGVTVSATNDNDDTARGTGNITYFGTYLIPLSMNYAIINLTTTDSALFGQTVTAYKDGQQIASAAFNVLGQASISVGETGTYVFKASEGGKFAKATVNVPNLLDTYSTTFTLTTIFAFHDTQGADTDSSITYPSGYSNSNFTNYAYTDLTTGEFHGGDWFNSPLFEFLIPKSCMLKSDCTVDYYLDENDESKKTDGTASDYNNWSYDGNAMMEWGQGKKIYWTIVPDSEGDGYTFVVGDGDYDGLLHPWNHYDKNNNVIPHFYTPKYHGTVWNNKLRSMAGKQASSNNTRQTDVTYARNNGDGWDTEVFADWFLVSMLLTMISKSRASQLKFGRGYCDYTWNERNDSKTNGGMYDKGLFYGTSSGTGLGVKVFGMEHPWGNMWRAIRGIMNISNTVKGKLTRGTVDGTSVSDYNFDGTGYFTFGTISGTSGGYISKMSVNSKGLAPNVVSGSETTYFSDGCLFGSGTMYGIVGGYWMSESPVGAFYIALSSSASSTYIGTGVALSCKPTLAIS